MMQQTSLESYVELQLEGTLGKRRAQVFTYISGHPRCSGREISKGLQLPINSICGRRNELLRMGYIKEDGTKYDVDTNRTVIAYKAMGD